MKHSTKAFIALGSNLSWQEMHPKMVLERAIALIGAVPEITVIRTSGHYQSPPLDGSNQPEYVNAVAEIKTPLSPHSLLHVLKKIELAFGRPKEHIKWSARTLDIDILLYGNLSLTSPELTIPHYDLKNRSFFVNPLLEINPHYQLPDGSTLNLILDPLLTQMSGDGQNFACFN